jgi:hypothetical protein
MNTIANWAELGHLFLGVILVLFVIIAGTLLFATVAAELNWRRHSKQIAEINARVDSEPWL